MPGLLKLPKQVTTGMPQLQGKCQCTTATTTVWPESLWAFPESCAADDSASEHSSSGSLS